MKIKFFLLFALFTFLSSAQTTISVESSDYAMVFQTDSNKRLQHTYFGKKLTNKKEYGAILEELTFDGVNEDFFNHVYTPSGTWNIVEPALQITHADGNTSTELDYVKHETKTVADNITLVTIDLIDPIYKTEVRLFFKIYKNENVFEQWATISNLEEGAILLKKYASANLYFKNGSFNLTQYHGDWANEMHPETHRLKAGMHVLDSKLGVRAHLYAPPTFMLSLDGLATEEQGKVLLGNLAWSGNYRFDFEMDRFQNLRLIAGANPHAAEYLLNANETFETPHFIFAYSENGKGEASRNMHRWARKYRIVDGDGDRLTLLNNWEATYFDFNEKKLLDLFDGAKEIGVDLFLLDDGWFGNKYPRNDDSAGLGDWQANKKKLPNGLRHLVEEAAKKDLKFGIWIEPEMVNPKSELYENHKDWVIHQPTRKEYYYRNQLVLDLSNPEVQDHVFNVFDNIFIENPNMAYVKWDSNSIVYNAHSPYLEQKKIPQTNLYMAYTKGLYDVFERVRAKYPKVPIMLCSGGGGRVDYGALQYFTEFWPSDNTAPIDRIFMHWEYSHFFPAIATSAHVTNWDKKASIKFRTDVAAMGKLGFDIVIDELSESDKEFCRTAVSDYDRFKEIIWYGDQYRLQDPYEHPVAGFQFVNEQKSQSVVFNYLVSQRYQRNYSPEPMRLKGLDPKGKYVLEELNLYPETPSPIASDKVYSGDFLMKVGLNTLISTERRSIVLLVTLVK